MQHTDAARRLADVVRAVRPPLPINVASSFASLEGRTALVTGVTDGSMGHGVALALARQGCAVACVDVASHKQSLCRACDSITAISGNATLAITADCTNRAELAAAFAEATEHLGPIRIVVAAVGGMGYTGGRGAGEEVKDADRFVDADLSSGFADLVQTTQFATYHTCQLAAQTMLTQGSGGRIIVIGSVMSDMGRAGSAACAFITDSFRCSSRLLLTAARTPCRYCKQGSHQAIREGPCYRAGTKCDYCKHHTARRDRHSGPATVRACCFSLAKADPRHPPTTHRHRSLALHAFTVRWNNAPQGRATERSRCG